MKQLGIQLQVITQASSVLDVQTEAAPEHFLNRSWIVLIRQYESDDINSPLGVSSAWLALLDQFFNG